MARNKNEEERQKRIRNGEKEAHDEAEELIDYNTLKRPPETCFLIHLPLHLV